MAQFKNSTLTVAGVAMITQSHALDDFLRFTRLAIGDGQVDLTADRKHRTALDNRRLDVPVAEVQTAPEKGVAIVCGHIDNKLVGEGDGFRITEIGAYAQNADGVERLYAYACVDESAADYLPDRTTPVAGTDVKVFVCVSDAANITANIDISYLLNGQQMAELSSLLTVEVRNRVTAATADLQSKVAALEKYLGTKQLWEVIEGNKLVPADFAVGAVPTQNGALVYTGMAQIPDWDGYDPSKLLLSGDLSAVDAGTYTVEFTPKDGCWWGDGTQTPQTVTWTIDRAPVALPAQSDVLTWNGRKQTPTWSGYDASKMDIGGETTAADAGTHTATFTPTANYCWPDGATTAKDVEWTIATAVIAATPTVSGGALTYNGKKQSPAWTGYNSSLLDISGETSAANAGTYTAAFTPKDGAEWGGGGKEPRSVAWTINKAARTLTADRAAISVFVGRTATITVGGA